MGTGIVSVGLRFDGQDLLSGILLVITSAVWLTLSVLLVSRARRAVAPA